MLGRESRSACVCANSTGSARYADYVLVASSSFSPLVPPSIDQIERHYTGTVGQSIKLSCQANGIPIPVITWHGIHNASGTALVDSFGNLYIDQLE
jgi:hypothetical protein